MQPEAVYLSSAVYDPQSYVVLVNRTPRQQNPHWGGGHCVELKFQAFQVEK